MPIRERAAAELEKMRHMSWKDRLWYIWEYYKFHLFGMALAVAALCTIAGMVYRQTFTTRLSIAVINDKSGGESSAASLEAGLRDALGCGKKDLIEINEGLHVSVSLDGETMSQYGYASLAKISALVASKSLDVVIADESALAHFASVSAFQSLEDFLPPELYERLRGKLYFAADGEGRLRPVGLSLEDTLLQEKTGILMDPPYLAVISGSPHREEALLMIQYLFP